MIVDVPYAHRARVQRPRRRAPDDDVFLGKLTCEIREASGAEAPVAMWWVSPSFQAKHWERDASRQVAVRSFGGRLYEPLSAADSGAEVGEAAAAGAARRHACKGKSGWLPALYDEDGFRRFGLGGLGPSDHRARTTLEAERSKRVVVLENEACIVERDLARKLGDLLLVDGIVFRDVGRPVFRPDGSYAQLAPSVAKRPELWWASASRPEDYAARSKEAARSGGYVSKADVRNLAPDVVDAGLLTFDMARWMAEGCARAILRDMAVDCRTFGDRAASRLAGYRRPVIMAYGELREAVAAGAATREVAERLLAFAEASSPEGTLRGEVAAATVAHDFAMSAEPGEDDVAAVGMAR